MFQPSLFLGFPLDKACLGKFATVQPEVLEAFIRNEPAYLQDFTHADTRYLGKSLENTVDLPQLELLENNIYSLINKLLPNHPCRETPLVLIAVPT